MPSTIPSAPVRALLRRHWVGRDELVEKYDVVLRRALTGRPGKSLMPIGLRGVGKTVLLNRFQGIARDRGLRIAFIEASGDFKAYWSLACDRFCSNSITDLSPGPSSAPSGS